MKILLHGDWVLSNIMYVFLWKLTKVACLIQGVWYKMLYHHTVVIKEWRDVARDVLCRTTLTWRDIIGMCHHTMYVISLFYISIKTNFKQIARVELKCVHYSEGDYILCMTSRYFFRSFTNVRLLCFGITNRHYHDSVILVHTTDSTWYKVLYHHTMYVKGIY
jgi:hypothetical protein